MEAAEVMRDALHELNESGEVAFAKPEEAESRLMEGLKSLLHFRTDGVELCLYRTSRLQISEKPVERVFSQFFGT